MADAPAWVKYPQAAQRRLLGIGIRNLIDTTQHVDQDTAHATFRQAFRFLEPFARTSLAKPNARHAAINVTYLVHAPHNGTSPYHRRWQIVRWWIEAWWVDGIYSADPQDPDLTAEDLIDPAPGQSTHYLAANAYRSLIIDALEVLADASTNPHPDHAITLYDRLYHPLRALAHPVLERLNHIQANARQVWNDHTHTEPRNVTRARRMDTIPHLIDAWHHAGVLGHRHTPQDPTTTQLVDDHIPQHLDWLEDQGETPDA